MTKKPSIFNNIFNLMESDPNFQQEVLIIGLIKNDILIACLKYDFMKARHEIDEEFYDFDLNLKALQLIGFSVAEIKNEVSLWYHFQIKIILDSRNKLQYSKSWIEEIAMNLYYELKKKKK
jgi:hypothetical protein